MGLHEIMDKYEILYVGYTGYITNEETFFYFLTSWKNNVYLFV